MYVTRLTKNLFCKCTLSRLVVVVGGGGWEREERRKETRLYEAWQNSSDNKNFVLEFRNFTKLLNNYKIMDRKRVCSTQRNIFSSLFSMDLRVDLYIFYSFFLFFLSSLRLFQKDPFRKGRYSFDEPEEPSYIRDHSRYKRVDNNLISSIARANDSHRVRGVARQNEVSANRAVWGG